MPTKRVTPRTADPVDEVEDDDDDTEEEAPPKAAGNGEAPTRRLRGGWTDARRQMESTSSWAVSFRPDEKSQFIKFLDAVPYVNFRRHWVERTNAQGMTGVRPYTCLKSFEEKAECPLCSIGDKVQVVSSFNVAVIGDDGQVLRKSWDCGPRLIEVLESYANDPKIAPLTRNFYMVNRTGKKGGTFQHNVIPMRASSLEEDHDVAVPTQADFDALERYTPDVVEVPTLKQLRDLVNELQDDYDD